MLVDSEKIERLIAEVAAEEVMPRFEKLEAGDVSEKSPGDLVTIADVATERRLTPALLDALAGSAAARISLARSSIFAAPAMNPSRWRAARRISRSITGFIPGITHRASSSIARPAASARASMARLIRRAKPAAACC